MVHDSQLPRACDRCHAIKERCCWAAGSDKCQRCTRLRHTCRTNRPARRPGRRPRPLSPVSSPAEPRGAYAQDQISPRSYRSDHEENSSGTCWESAGRDGSPPSISRGLALFGDVSPAELSSLQRMLFGNETFERFLMGPTFYDVHRKMLVSHLLASTPVMIDAYLACANSWVVANDIETTQDCQRGSYQRAAAAMANLRSFQVSSPADVSQCLVLGASILTFALKLRVPDLSAICNGTLRLIAPVYASCSDPDQDELGFLTCMLMSELEQCLVQCRVPALRFTEPRGGAHVDRYVGLCVSLLAHFHSICEVSHAMSRACRDGSNGIAETIDSLVCSLQEWQPSVPDGFCDRFTATEVAHMLCQAQVLRMAGLLIIHRLRYPYGTSDGEAEAISMSILTQLDTTYVVTKKPVKCTEVALIAACFELRDERQRRMWLDKASAMVGYSDHFKDHVRDTLRKFWYVKDTSARVCWYDLGEKLSPFLA